MTLLKVHYCGWDDSCQQINEILGGPRNRRLHIDTPWFHAFVDLRHWDDRWFQTTKQFNTERT